MARSPDDQRARIREEAATWLEMLERTITVEESVEFREWLKASLHREVIVERCKLQHGPEILAVLGELIPVETFSERAERHHSGMMIAIVLTVSVLAFATIAIAFSRVWSNTDDRLNPLRAESSIRTEIGERKRVELPDGGSIILNTATQLQFRYMPRSRDVILIRGEAMFDVKDDPERPFVVQAGARRFVALQGGATFNVHIVNQENTELTVMRGQVRTPESRSSVPRSPALLRARVSYGAHTFRAGEGGVVGLDWQLPRTVQPKELGERTAWQRGVVAFENEARREPR